MIKRINNQHLHNIEDKQKLWYLFLKSVHKSENTYYKLLQIPDHLEKCSDIMKIHIDIYLALQFRAIKTSEWLSL